MNPFYNSYQDTLLHHKDYSSLENHISTLLKAICSYLNIPVCINDLSMKMTQALDDQIHALFDCFLRSNCSNLISQTNETNKFQFSEVVNNMQEKFSFLQRKNYEKMKKWHLFNCE